MRKLWNGGWRFLLLPLGSQYADVRRDQMVSVQLPHDWLIANTEDLYASGDGWYVKNLTEEEAAGDCVLLDFDGVYMDCDVLLNGEVLLTHRYGYTPFFVDLTGKLQRKNNEIAVHIRHQSPNSRWYSGAGIFRDVHLLTLPRDHMIPDGFQVNTGREGEGWTLTVEAELAGSGGEMPWAVLRDQVENTAAEGRMRPREGGAELTFRGLKVKPWNVGDPALYRLELILGAQREEMNVGFRETEFTADRGFFLNGEHVKLHGVCLHHDLGALGAAFHEKAAERQLKIMREMGVNAIRTAHNPPARQLLDLCDRMGMLVMDELYDMWELPKTPFDNARFFPETYPRDLAEWVRRDRCHPSVILWSIGNEIHDMQASDRGQEWTRLLMEEVLRHDTRHARVTFASNYMPWEGAQKCADIVKLPGYNYAERYYAGHHERHPDWVIFGSETGSILASRGIYHFPYSESILSEEDLQCSALLNSNTSWGAQDIRKLLADDLATPYSLGQFIWAGIDYIGEPTPYQTRCCYFGQTDTAGFPKDAYYFFQAMWTERPMIHIGVSWDWNEGQLIDVPVMTNGAEAELILNGQSLGRKKVDRGSAETSLPVWRVPFRAGVLTARAYDEAGNAICEYERKTPGEAKRLCLASDRDTLNAGVGDMAFITVSAVDAQGRPVENAGNRVHVELEGPGVLLGLDNGDSTDRDGYQVFSRRLFSGKLLIIAGAGGEKGKLRVRVSSPGLDAAEAAITVLPCPENAEKRVFQALCKPGKEETETWIRRIDLRALSSTALTPDRPSVTFEISALPHDAMAQEIDVKVTNAQGVDMPCAALTRRGNRVTLTARGDGNMYLRAFAGNGYPHPRVMSVIEVRSEGFGQMELDPYGFIAGALSDLREGDIGAGNERGVTFARESESAVGFSRVDFGPVGSDEITLPIFALDDGLYEIGFWDGMPHQGGRKIAVLPYRKKSIWNTYQAETYRLPEVLSGVHTVAFSLDRKVHLKGFSFTRQSRAMRKNRALDADQLYGDSFRKNLEGVKEIGNNVTLRYDNMEFDRAGTVLLTLEGATDLENNTVSLRVVNREGDERVSTCAFRRSFRGEQTFPVDVPQGMCTVFFVFLPGSRFDFYSFRFEKMQK